MPEHKPLSAPMIMHQLKKNIARGKAARDYLASRLAELPPKQIAKIPRGFWERLGPQAIVKLAEVLANTRDIAPAQRPHLQEPAPRPAVRPPALWLISGYAAVLVVGAVFCMSLLERPAWWLVMQRPEINRGGQMRCGRLDRWTDNCVFQVTGNDFTLMAAAQQLGVDIEKLAWSNPGLPLYTPLPIGTPIRVPLTPRR